MQYYTYPKVPNYYHESVEQTVFSAPDLRVIEKLDGSNCKLCVFDSRYSHLYANDIDEYNPEQGDVFISSKSVVRGRLQDPITEFDGAFRRLVRSLRNEFDANILLELHNEFESPLVLFGEHMIPHTIDYDYTENPPPSFIGFDVLNMNEHTAPPSNPFDERFNAFLDFEEAWNVFYKLGLDTAPIIHESVDELIFDKKSVEDFKIPDSEYGNVTAEGVVFRSDVCSRRVKLVTEEFRERASKVWGKHEKNVESGAELFCARYVTNGRIQKIIHKIVHDSTTKLCVETVTKAVITDVWHEELADIMKIDTTLCPSEVFSIIENRCEMVLRKMEQNSALNDVDIDSIWEEFRNTNKMAERSGTICEIDTDIPIQLSQHLEQANVVERALVDALLSENYVNVIVNEIVRNSEKEIGRWVIVDCYEALNKSLWYRNLGVIANLRVAFTPQKAQNELLQYVKHVIDSHDDITVPESSDNENSNSKMETTDTTGFETVFDD